MVKEGTIKRFIYAQMSDHNEVVKELYLTHRKRTCWMWYTFPQIKGLGYSDIAKYYEFQCLGEVRAFVANDYLYYNIVELMEILLEIRSSDAIAIFGPIDARKLQSSMTVLKTTPRLKGFADAILNKYFDGEPCERTIEILKTMEDK